MKNPSQILMTADTRRGIWTYIMELCSYFERKEIEVILAVTGEPAAYEQRQEISRLSNVIYYEKNYKLEWMDDPWLDIKKSGEWLMNLENKHQPDIIHLNSFSYGSLPWQAPVIVAGHWCKLSWWKSVKNGPPPSEWNEYYRQVYNGLHGADFVIATSRFMLQSLNIIYGDFRNQQVIYNGRDKSLFSVSCNKEDYIVTAGRIWDEAKNITSVIEAAPHIPWKIVVAGGNVSPINKKTAAGHIEYLGKLSLQATSDLFSRASIFVLPARYEPFGLTPLEAALSGCALVLGKTASLLEIWEDSALFVTPGDVDEMVFILNNLIGHRDLLRLYAVKAHQRASKLSSVIMGQEYLSLYRRLIKNELLTHKAVI